MCKRLLIFTLIYLQTGFAIGQNVGIGLSNPLHSPLEISGAVGRTVAIFGNDKFGVGVGMNPPFLGFNYIFNNSDQVVKAGYAALITMDTLNGDVHFGNFSNTAGVTDFGNINNYQTRMLVKQNGNVGIGTLTPAFPLTVSYPTDFKAIQESPDGTGRIGFLAAAFESGVVTAGDVALNFATGNGVSRMQLQTNGTLLVNETININEKLTSVKTGSANLLPIAMGKVDPNGNILSATPGVFVTKTANGNYAISFSFEPNLYANRDNYVLQLSTEGNVNALAANYVFRNDNTLFVKTWTPTVLFTTGGCTCGGGSPSLVFGSASAFTDCVFSFILKKF